MSSRAPSWTSTVGWEVPSERVDWSGTLAWLPSFERVCAAGTAKLHEALEHWDARLASVGGDPAREDWSRFRPLRLSREEDWSDWLAHLVEQSESGRLPARLFSRSNGPLNAARFRVKRVDREVVADEYRADLVIFFSDDEWAHVEVKVGDLAFEKTPSTARALRNRLGGTCRDDFILLPARDVAGWSGQVTDPSIRVLTWEQVARALRDSILEADKEGVTWRVWGRAFLGAIEQHLLGLAPVPRAAAARRRLSSAELARLSYLEQMPTETP